MSTTVEYEILVEVLESVKGLKKLHGQSKKTEDGLDKTKKSGLTMAAEIGAAFTGLSGAASAVTGAVTKVVGAFVGAADAAFKLTRAVADNINDLNDLSNVSGVSAQSIEALKLAFVSSGQGAEAANTVLAQFPRVLTSIQKGTGDASVAFKALGLSARDSAGKMKAGDQIFGEVVGSLQSIEDKTTKAQLATAIFGRSAAGLTQALGAGDFEEFTGIVERFGSKATPEASEAAANFQKRLALLSFAGDRAKQSLIQAVGGMKVMDTVMIHLVAILRGAIVFFDKGSEGIMRFSGSLFNMTKLIVSDVLLAMSNLVWNGFGKVIKAINMVSEAVSGKALIPWINFEGVITTTTQGLLGMNDGLKAGVQAYKEELAVLQQFINAQGRSADATKLSEAELAKLQSTLDSLMGKQGKSTKKSNDGLKKQIALLKKLSDAALAARKKRDAATADAGKIQEEANKDLLSSLDKINQLEQRRIDKLKEITRLHGVNTEEAQKAVKARGGRERVALGRRDAAQGVDVATTAIGTVGDPSAMIGAIGAAFGPVGMAVAGTIDALSSLGQKDPEEIKKEFEATFQGIAQGIKILAPLLLEILPPILFEAAGMIIDAVIQLPFLIIAGFIKGIAGIWDRVVLFFKEGFWKSLGNFFSTLFENLVKLITEPFNNLFGDSKMGGGRMLSAQSGLRFTGANQGIAMLHQGEMVVPRSGQMSSTVQRDVGAQVGGGGVTININSAITERSAVDALVRKIEQRFGGFGQSTSPLFGGL